MTNQTQVLHTQSGGSALQYAPASVVGLTVGTMLLTPGGSIAAEDLREGDRVLTKDYGYQRLQHVGLCDVDLMVHSMAAPVRIAADALGLARPAEDICLAPDQRVALRHPMYDALFGAREVVARARDLTDLPGVQQLESLSGITYVTLGLNRPQVILSGSLALNISAADDGHCRPALTHQEARLACTMITSQFAIRATRRGAHHIMLH